MGFTESDIEKILAASIWEDEKLGEEGTISFERNIMPKPTPKSNRKTPTKRLTITSLLGTLRNTVQSEALQFAFDYLALHRICWRMLREVRKACDSMLLRVAGGAVPCHADVSC
jgi:hypothetical protein